MHSISKALALSTLFSASNAVNTWKVAFWSGEYCASQSSGIDQGPSFPQLSQVCNPIPHIGFTQALDFEVANGDYTYTLGLHKSDDCSDSGGSYQGLPDQPICESTKGGFTHYSIHTLAAISKRESGAESTLTLGRRTSAASEKRQNVAYEAFALTAGIASAHFFTTATGECTAYRVDGGDVEQNKCGANLAAGTVFSFVTAYGLRQAFRGTRQTTGPSRIRRESSRLPRIPRGLGQVGEDTIELAEDFRRLLCTPFPFTNIIDGYSGVIEHPTNITDHEGEEWIHWPITHTHTESEKTFGSTLKYHAKSGTHVIASDSEDVREANSVRSKHRRGQQITAYYGWRRGADVQSIPTDRSSVDDLAAQIYNFGVARDREQFCANLQGGVAGSSLTRTLTHGNFALTRGVFNDQSGKC